MALPPPIVPLSEIALIDENAIASGLAIDDLMDRAGAALAGAVSRRLGRGRVLIATGGGNNGGDGWSCARQLADQGFTVSVWPVKPPKSACCQQMAAAAEGRVTVLSGPPSDPPDLIVDAILGSGVSGPLRSDVADALDHLRDYGVPVVAADAPTGIGTDQQLPNCTTICFQVGKAELVADPRVAHYEVVDIGIPEACVTEIQASCCRRFPYLDSDAHKGQHGQVVVLGGGRFPGALELACRSALATGCDLVHAWTADGPPLPPSIVVHRQPGPTLAPADPDSLTALLLRADAILIGPGLGRGPGGPEAAEQAFELALDLGVPMVIDADGITALGSHLRQMPTGDVPVIVTPHRREAQSLLGEEPTDAALHGFARPDRVVLRKGVVDFVSNGLRWQTNHRGNPRMTVGGTGDCLAGLTAGLLARHASPFDAARIALFWLTSTADRCWQSAGPCYTPEDLIQGLPAVLRDTLCDLDCWPPGG